MPDLLPARQSQLRSRRRPLPSRPPTPTRAANAVAASRAGAATAAVLEWPRGQRSFPRKGRAPMSCGSSAIAGRSCGCCGKIAVLEKRVQSLAALRIVERAAGRSWPSSNRRNASVKRRGICHPASGACCRACARGDVRAGLAVARAGQQHHMLIGIRRWRRPRADGRADAGRAQVARDHRQKRERLIALAE